MKVYLILIVGVLMCEALTAFDKNPILSEEQEKNVRQYFSQCMEEQSSAPDKTDCFAYCIMTKMGFMVDDDIQMDVVKRTLEPLLGSEKYEEITTKCSNIKDSNNCDTAKKLWECYLLNSPK